MIDLQEVYMNLDYEDYNLFMSALSHEINSIGEEAFYNKWKDNVGDCEKFHQKCYLSALLEHMNGGEKIEGHPEYDEFRFDKMVIPYRYYTLFFEMGSNTFTENILMELRDQLEDIYCNSIKCFINHNILLEEIYQAV